MEILVLAVGAVLLTAALVKGGAGGVAWLLFRWRMGRWLTTIAVVVLVVALLRRMAG